MNATMRTIQHATELLDEIRSEYGDISTDEAVHDWHQQSMAVVRLIARTIPDEHAGVLYLLWQRTWSGIGGNDNGVLARQLVMLSCDSVLRALGVPIDYRAEYHERREQERRAFERVRAILNDLVAAGLAWTSPGRARFGRKLFRIRWEGAMVVERGVGDRVRSWNRTRESVCRARGCGELVPAGAEWCGDHEDSDDPVQIEAAQRAQASE